MDTPITLIEKQLEEIIKLLKDMKPQNSMNKADLKNEVKTENKPQGKVCKYCGKVHDKPIDYAICARKNKKKKG